jgi:hypothetical protein
MVTRMFRAAGLRGRAAGEKRPEPLFKAALTVSEGAEGHARVVNTFLNRLH